MQLPEVPWKLVGYAAYKRYANAKFGKRTPLHLHFIR